MNRQKKYKFLRELYIFNALEDEEVRGVARIFEEQSFPGGKVIFEEGDPGEYFYLIVSGRVDLASHEGHIGTLGRKDSLGEVALLQNRPRSATATTVEPCLMLRVDRNMFQRMLQRYPQVKKFLKVLTKSYALARRKDFRWLRDNEVVQIIERKHIAIFFMRLFVPGLIGWGIFFLLFNAASNLIFLGVPVLLLFLYGVWTWVDVRNDYYIVTSHRVVRIEKKIWLSDLRKEAPLDTILSVNTRSNQVQRSIGYADVVVRTYTGDITMRDVAHPQQLADMVTAYWHLAEEKMVQDDMSKFKTSIQDRLWNEESEEEIEAKKIAAPSEEELKRQKAERKIDTGRFDNLFKTRYEMDGVITYRKHLFVLIRRIWLYLLLYIFLGVFILSRLVNLVDFPSLLNLLIFTVVLLILTFPFMAYRIADWANDRFMLTEKEIIDVDRKPFGQEQKRSAALDNILSLDYKRQNLLQRLLNFGTVSINVGDIQLDFNMVAKPDLVQREISDYFYRARKRKAEKDARQRREDMVEFLAAYHEEKERHEDDFQDDTEPPTMF
jgi:uncharacterized membrane protein YdbT with pleckstrin-like domain